METFNLILQGNQNIIPLEKDDHRFGCIYTKIAILILGHLNPSICDEKGNLTNLVGKAFYSGGDLYEIISTEGVVGYPERMAQMATAKLFSRESMSY